MSDETPTAIREVEGLLGRLQQAYRALMEAVAEVAPEQFELEDDQGDSIQRILERTADDVNLYYGRLVARAVSLPQPPGLEPADFGSPAEAKLALQAAHRHLSNLLHDLAAEDLDRTTRLESTADYTLRQVLETAVAHYRLRAGQLEKTGEGQKRGA